MHNILFERGGTNIREVDNLDDYPNATEDMPFWRIAAFIDSQYSGTMAATVSSSTMNRLEGNYGVRRIGD